MAVTPQSFNIVRRTWKTWAGTTQSNHGVRGLCLGSDWPSSQTFHSSERRHRGLRYFYLTRLRTVKGLDKEQVGEDVTGGYRPSGPSNKDITNEMEMSAEKCATQIPFTLSQCGGPTLEKCCELCTAVRAREKCASAGVQVGVVSTLSVALTAVATG